MSDDKLTNSFPAPPPSQTEIDAFVSAAGKGDILAVNAFLSRHPGAIEAQNSRNDGCTAMNNAAHEGQKAMVEMLLSKGAAVDGRSKANWSPLITAASAGRTDIVELLLERGAQMEATAQEGWTALMWAARFEKTETVRFLLEKGADLNAVNAKNMNALAMAQWDRGGGETADLIEQWPEMIRQREELERQTKERAIAEAEAREVNARRLENLKSRRPPSPPFKKKGPRP
ncbi:MAG: ankyrin repeat domain-containing protein [Alphaproteobacteria bacterium]|nr:ankyrin repeat domain-containing protein [Alphaproteobacteria bacterium]